MPPASLPYQERMGHRLARDLLTKKLVHDESGWTMSGPEEENYPKTTRTGKATKNKQKGSLEESCESLIVCTNDLLWSAQPTEEKKEEERFHCLNVAI